MQEPERPSELQEHMLWTYYGLRVALAIIGIGLPIILFLVGLLLHRAELQTSISSYYHTPSVFHAVSTRDIFVGGLVAAAFCLYLYKGYSNRENILLNIAAVFAVGVALIPSTAPNTPQTTLNLFHTISAILFFGCLGVVSWLCAKETLHLVTDATKQARYRFAYNVAAVLMVVVLPVLAVLAVVFRSRLTGFQYVFFLEAFGMWSFGGYWIVKTFEMREGHVERMALDAELRRGKASPPTGRETEAAVLRA